MTTVPIVSHTGQSMNSHHTHTGRHYGTVTVLTAAFALTLGFALVEAVAGWWFQSLALISDAGHMLTDSTALAVAMLAAWFAKLPATTRHSFGFGRIEVLAAIFNGLLMLVLISGIVVTAINRFQTPVAVTGEGVMIVAALGLCVNVGVLYLLSHGEKNLTQRSALLHVMGDLMGSGAALMAGVVVFFTGWMTIDPILSLLISVLILISTYRILSDVVNVILEGVPPGLNLPDISAAMTQVAGVTFVHDLHIWAVSSNRHILTAHVEIIDISQWQKILVQLQCLLAEQYQIDQITLQPEFGQRALSQNSPETSG